MATTARIRSGSGKPNMEELISLTFAMGQMMRERNHKECADGPCSSLLGLETLWYVQGAGEPSMRDIAKQFHISPPAATLMVDGLVKGKLLKRVLDPRDRRSVRITLTAQGKKALAQGRAKKIQGLKKIFGVLSAEERKQFSAIIKKIITTNQ